jgi:flagellar hook protein FlgE
MPDIDALIADARRAALPGAIGYAPDRPGALIGVELPGGAVLRSAPRASALDVSIDGPGLFVLDRSGRRRFSRLGDFGVDALGYLTNGAGARALGFGTDARGDAISGLAELRVPPADIASRKYDAYAIDERGIFSGITRRIDARSGRPLTQSLALAVMPAPERLTLDGETMLAPNAAAGNPTIVAAGDTGAARLRTHALETGMVDLEGDLARLWGAARRAEFAQAVAAATDQNSRTALGLVK